VAYRERILDRIRPDDPNDVSVEWLQDLIVENEDIVEWPAQQILGLLPRDIQQKYGTRSFSGVSRPCLMLHADDASSIVAELEQRGFSCERSEEVCKQATGMD
jgi:hypothetical protein